MRIIKIKDVNEKIYEHTTDSGLKVYIWPYSLSEEIVMTLTTKYGSIDTDFKVGKTSYHLPNGIAHFLEHIKFNEKGGTAHDYFYKIGSYTNAYTTYDHTSYEVTCTGNLKQNLEHLLFFVYNPYFTKNLVEKEKGIICEEAKMSMDDPYNMGYQRLLENTFKYNKRRNLVTGVEEDINKTTVEDAIAVFDNFYHPENMFLTVTGNVNPYEVAKITDEYFSKNPFKKYNKPKMLNKKEPDEVVKEKDVLKTNVTKEKLFMAFKIPKKDYKGIPDLNLNVLFNIVLTINFGTTSEFNDYLIKHDLIDDIYYSFNFDSHHLLIIFESSTSYPKEVIKLIKEQMKKLSISESEFTRKKKVLISRSILGYEDATDVNNDIRGDIIRYGKIISNLQNIYKSLTLEDAQDIINRISLNENSYVILKPLD